MSTNAKTTKSLGKKVVKKTAKTSKVKEEPVEQVAVETPKKTTKRASKKPVETEEVEVPVSAPVKETKKRKTAKAKETSEVLEEEAKEVKKSKRTPKVKKEQDPPQEETEEVEKEKKPKKINDKPTLSDICGLNISVAKVKNIISNLCINSEPFWALKEMKDHRVMEEKTEEGSEESPVDSDGKKVKRQFTFTLDGLTQQTLDYLERAYQNSLESAREVHAKDRVKEMSSEDRKKYMDARKKAVLEYNAEFKNTHLFQSHEFDAVSFNTKWDKNFYKGMTTDNWRSLKDMELYNYCTNLVNKMKIRFNAESKIFITAFVEHILKQMVVNGTVNCVLEGKKIIKLEHALDTTSENFSERFSLYPMITHLKSFAEFTAKQPVNSDEENTEETPAPAVNSEEVDENQADRKYQFKHYVSELCRTVKMELARADSPDDISQSVYSTTSVSKLFKDFCSSVIVDLIRVLGDLLKIEVASRNVKTVNYTIIQTLLHLLHATFGLESQLDDTVQFIQERYCIHQKYLEERKEKRGVKGEDEEEDEEL